jgi:hypothetical protein
VKRPLIPDLRTRRPTPTDLRLGRAVDVAEVCAYVIRRIAAAVSVAAVSLASASWVVVRVLNGETPWPVDFADAVARLLT